MVCFCLSRIYRPNCLSIYLLHLDLKVYDQFLKDFDVKFTIIINNSEHNYSGGDFELFTYGGAVKVPELNNVGTAIMFRSDIVHRVLPITKGKRSSMVFFIEGGKFR